MVGEQGSNVDMTENICPSSQTTEIIKPCNADAYLTCCFCFSEINKSPSGKKCQVVKELKDFTAGLMYGSNHRAPISCQVPQS